MDCDPPCFLETPTKVIVLKRYSFTLLCFFILSTTSCHSQKLRTETATSPSSMGKLSCGGAGPFWTVEVSENKMAFYDPHENFKMNFVVDSIDKAKNDIHFSATSTSGEIFKVQLAKKSNGCS